MPPDGFEVREAHRDPSAPTRATHKVYITITNSSITGYKGPSPGLSKRRKPSSTSSILIEYPLPFTINYPYRLAGNSQTDFNLRTDGVIFYEGLQLLDNVIVDGLSVVSAVSKPETLYPVTILKICPLMMRKLYSGIYGISCFLSETFIKTPE